MSIHNDKNTCGNCGKTINTMAFRGTGTCSVDCRKQLGLDKPHQGTLVMMTHEEAKNFKENGHG